MSVDFIEKHLIYDIVGTHDACVTSGLLMIFLSLS